MSLRSRSEILNLQEDNLQVELFCFELEASHWEVLQDELGKPDGRIKTLTLASIEGVHEETIGPIARTAAAVPEVHFQVAEKGDNKKIVAKSKYFVYFPNVFSGFRS